MQSQTKGASSSNESEEHHRTLSESEIQVLAAMTWDECISQAEQKGADDPEALCGWLKAHGPNASVARNINAGAIVDKFTQNDRLYLKAFLLDDGSNLNDWGVTSESLRQRISTFIGKPLVLTSEFGHPSIDDYSYDHILQNQESYRVGTIIDIVNKGSVYYAIIEVTNPAAKEAITNGDAPFYVSPAIYKLAANEVENKIENWLGVHLAIVSDPAYTVKKAVIKDRCTGDKDTCLLQLRKAHVEKHGYGNCGFCIKGAFEAHAISSNKIKTAQVLTTDKTISDSYSVSSLFKNSVTTSAGIMQNTSNTSNANTSAPQVQQQIPTGVGVAPPQPVVANQAVQQAEIPQQQTTVTPQVQQQQVPQVAPEHKNYSITDETGMFQGEIERLSAENSMLKQVNTELRTANEAFAKKVAFIEGEYRKGEIERIITAEIIPDETERNNKIQTLLATTLSPNQIRDIYKDIIALKRTGFGASTSVPAQTTSPYYTASTNTTHGYEAKLPLRTAATQQQKSELESVEEPYWVQLANSVVRQDGGAT